MAIKGGKPYLAYTPLSHYIFCPVVKVVSTQFPPCVPAEIALISTLTRQVCTYQRLTYLLTLSTYRCADLTGKKPSQPTHYYAERIHGLELPGMVLLEQIKTIDKRRVKKYLGRMTRQQMDEIGEAIEEALGLYVPEEMEAP